MSDSAALLADEVLPAKPMRQLPLSLPFALRFLLATDPKALTQVLGTVYRTISGHILGKARLTHANGATGVVTLIQRFGSALNRNVHPHMLVLDGTYVVGTEPPVFRRIAPPRQGELQALVEWIAERIGRALERQGLLARDAENSYLDLAPEGPARWPICSATRSRTEWRSAHGLGGRCFRYRPCRREKRSHAKVWRSTRGSRCMRGSAWKPSSERSSNGSHAM